MKKSIIFSSFLGLSLLTLQANEIKESNIKDIYSEIKQNLEKEHNKKSLIVQNKKKHLKKTKLEDLTDTTTTDIFHQLTNLDKEYVETKSIIRKKQIETEKRDLVRQLNKVYLIENPEGIYETYKNRKMLLSQTKRIMKMNNEELTRKEDQKRNKEIISFQNNEIIELKERNESLKRVIREKMVEITELNKELDLYITKNSKKETTMKLLTQAITTLENYDLKKDKKEFYINTIKNLIYTLREESLSN